MKKQLLFIVAIFLCMNLSAQDDQRVVILSTSGKVGLISAGKTKVRPVESGAVALSSGQLKLGKGAKVTLLCQNQFRELKEAQTIALFSVCDGSGTRKMDVDFNFANKVMAAVDMVSVAKQEIDGWGNAVGDPKKSGDGWGNAVGDPKKSGDGWGNAVGDPKKSGDGWGNAVGDPKKSGDGWGGKGSAIRLIMPFKKLVAGKTTFSWSKPANKEPYQLTIMDATGKIIHTVAVLDTFAVIDLKALNLATTEIYQWKVTVAGSTPVESNELKFALDTEAALASTLASAQHSALAKSSQDPIFAGLIEASELENGDWLYAAHQAYAALEQKGNNHLVDMMHAAFWMRYGFKRLASKVAQGK